MPVTAPSSPGVVRYDARINCYRLGEHPVVWPFGTTVSDDGEVITLADGTQVHMGDHVSGGGGFAPFDQWARWSELSRLLRPRSRDRDLQRQRPDRGHAR